MPFVWTKTWTSSDDGSVLSAVDLANLQGDLNSQCVTLGGTQTITGLKTFSQAPKVDTLGGYIKYQILSITKTYADFSTNNTTNTINLITIPADTIILDAFCYLTTTFSGGSITSYYIQVGDDNDIDGILDDNDTTNGINVFTGATTGYRCKSANQKGAYFEAGGTYIISSSTIIKAKATASHNLNTATQGEITFFFVVVEDIR